MLRQGFQSINRKMYFMLYISIYLNILLVNHYRWDDL